MSIPNPVYHLEPGDKAVPVMVYTSSCLLWGDLIIKEVIRASTWLRTNVAPDWVALHNARCLLTNTTSDIKPITLPKAYIPTPEVLAFHLLPPHADPIDYDPNEPNRKMEPVTVLTGPYRIDAFIRMAGVVDLHRFMDVSHETFTSLYNAEISRIDLPAQRPMRISYLIVRQVKAVFADRPLSIPKQPSA